MKSHFTRILLLAAFLIFANTSSADILYGRVLGIADGAIVTVLDAINTQDCLERMMIIIENVEMKKRAGG